MPRLLVAPLSSLSDALAAHVPTHLVSLLSPEHMIGTPAGFPAAMHLRLGVNDIVDPAAGTAPPARKHIDELLEFSRGWDTSQPFLIHCWAGISRSMASAFTILCDRRRWADAHEAAWRLAGKSPDYSTSQGLSRRYAAGIIALRPDRDGTIAGYDGFDEVHRRFGGQIIDQYLPPPGTPTQPVSAGYMANAWVRMKHPDYDGLREMLDFVGQTAKVRAR